MGRRGKTKAEKLLDADNVMPWERQPKETVPAWEAFKTYRDLGMKRSTANVQRTIGKSKRLIDGWSSKKNWVARCAAWDREQDRIGREARTKEIRDMHRRHTKLAMGGLAAVAHSLKQHIPTGDNPEAKPMAPKLVAQLLKACSALERISRGEPDEIHEVRGKVGWAELVKKAGDGSDG